MFTGRTLAERQDAIKSLVKLLQIGDRPCRRPAAVQLGMNHLAHSAEGCRQRSRSSGAAATLQPKSPARGRCLPSIIAREKLCLHETAAAHALDQQTRPPPWSPSLQGRKSLQRHEPPPHHREEEEDDAL
jgi:hypothetical protein